MKNKEKLNKNVQDLSYFKKAIDNATDAIGISTPEGRHYYQNQAFTELFGLSVEETDGKSGPPSSIYVDEKIGREVFSTIMNGKVWIGEAQFYNKNRDVIDVSLRAYPVKDENNKVSALVGIHTDITKRKKEHKELRKKLAELVLFHKVTVNRELKMIELKKENKTLKKRIAELER